MDNDSVVCQKCGTKNSPANNFCQSCAAPLKVNTPTTPQQVAMIPKKKGLKGWQITLIVIGAIFVIGAIGSNLDKSDDANSSMSSSSVSKATTPAPTQEQIIIVSAKDLAKAYTDNEVKADQDYKGKKAEITGKITDIGVILSQTYIVLSSEVEYSITNVQCFFKDKTEIAKIANMKKGDIVTVIGRIGGKSLNVTVDECIIK